MITLGVVGIFALGVAAGVLAVGGYAVGSHFGRRDGLCLHPVVPPKCEICGGPYETTLMDIQEVESVLNVRKVDLCGGCFKDELLSRAAEDSEL